MHSCEPYTLVHGRASNFRPVYRSDRATDRFLFHGGGQWLVGPEAMIGRLVDRADTNPFSCAPINMSNRVLDIGYLSCYSQAILPVQIVFEPEQWKHYNVVLNQHEITFLTLVVH